MLNIRPTLSAHELRALERRFATVQGVRLAYSDRCEADDRSPVVLLHGLGDTADTWRETVDALAPHRRVIALDQRGHGHSEWTKSYELREMAGDVVGLIEQLGIATVDLVGHSMGAMVAYLTAETEPELVRRLVLEEPPPPIAASPPRDEGTRPDGELGYDWQTVDPSFPSSSNEAGRAGKTGKPRTRKRRKKKETAEDE